MEHICLALAFIIFFLTGEYCANRIYKPRYEGSGEELDIFYWLWYVFYQFATYIALIVIIGKLFF